MTIESHLPEARQRVADPFTIAIEERDGRPRLVMYGIEGWTEPICPECNEPVRWVLDMYSMMYDKGVFVLGHARCLWTKNGFRVQEALAKE